jgi:hypothetical protein
MAPESVYIIPFNEDGIMKKMIKIVILLSVMGLLVSPVAMPGRDDLVIFNDFFMTHLPGGFFYTSYLENYAPDTVLMIEESNGFALIDSPKVYFEGDSYVQFNWFYNGFDINSVLDGGTPALQFPFSSTNQFRLQGESPASRGYGFHFLSRIPEQNISRLLVSSIYSNLGGAVSWASFLNSTPATERDDYLSSEYRKNLGNFFVDYTFNKKFNKSNMMISFNYFDISRQFNDFNELDTTFTEPGRMFLFSSRFTRELEDGKLDVSAAFNYLNRSNLNAELGRYPQETFLKEKYSFFGGVRWEKSFFDLKLSFIHETENLGPFEQDFSKDLMDIDGEGIVDFGRMGDFSGNAVAVDLDVPLLKKRKGRGPEINAFFDCRFSSMTGDETIHDHNTLFFNGDPYLVYKWQDGNDYSHSNLQADAGFELSYDVTRSVRLFSKLWISRNTLNVDFNENDLGFWSPGFDLGLNLFRNRKTEIMVAYGHIPYDLRGNAGMFLETGRPSATIYHWQDMNNDLVYQSGEEGGVYGYSGGDFHLLDPTISRPYKKRFLLTVKTRISKQWTLLVKGIYKTIKNNFWIQFDREYGFYENRDGIDVYFFDQPFQRFQLTNEPFDENPFYAQLLLHLQGGQPNRWFFSFSFLAHIGMGHTAFGNGPGTSDIGVLDESQANPNSWINGYGRLDGDRAFVGRVYAGFHILKNLFLGCSLKYRDGTPFAFINSVYDYNQWVLFYSTIKAEDERGVKGGPREDYLSDMSIQLNYRFSLFRKDACLSLAYHNILNAGYELSEYVFSGGSRDAAELNIPQSIRLTFTVNF